MNHPDTNSVTDAAQLKADIVLLIDLITEHSRKVELVTHEDLRDEFLSKAPMQQPIPVSQIKAEYEAIPEMERKLRNKADDSPEEKERRRLISRRQMFGSLFSGELCRTSPLPPTTRPIRRPPVRRLCAVSTLTRS